MNYMKKVAEMLGVKLGERFYLDVAGNVEFVLLENGLHEYVDEFTCKLVKSDFRLEYILYGDLKIIKIQNPILDDGERMELEHMIEYIYGDLIAIKRTSNEYHSFISFIYKKDNFLFTDCKIIKDSDFEGMRLDKEYTLEELGL